MSLGKDLATIRKGLGLTLEEIQNTIKIPTHILKTIENDSIFDSIEHNKTYIRSFIRSYARGLKIDDEKIVAALDATEAGLYDHDLLAEEEPVEVDETPEEPFNPADIKPPQIEQAPAQPTPTVENVNWADLGKRFTLQDSGSRLWIFLLIFVFVVIVVSIGFYFRGEIAGLFSSSDEPVEQTELSDTNLPSPALSTEDPETSVDNEQLNQPVAEDETINAQDQNTAAEEIPSDDSEEEVTAESEDENRIVPVITQTISSLPDTISVVVYAAFDKLEPVRVTSDLNGRTNPFWMEPGEAYIFDFSDTLRVRGQYSRMLLMFNGHVIEDAEDQFYEDEFDAVILTRGILNDPSYLNEASQEFPYSVGAPDSIVYRIRY